MYRSIWNAKLETLEPEAQRSLERDRLSTQLKYVYAKSSFYRSKFQEANLVPEAVRHVEDLTKLPFTTKAELRESQERQPPFGDYLAAPLEKVATVHRTSGSTGRFIYTVLSRNDLKQNSECGARAFWAGGLRPNHIVVHCLNYNLWMGGYTDHRSLETTGAAVVPFGVGNSHQLVRRIQEAGIDTLSSTPSYPAYLENVVRQELGVEPVELGLKLGLLAGEPGLENHAFKRRVEETWGFRASNSYGMADVISCFAGSCEDSDDLHFMGQGAVLPQLIDPVTGEDLAIMGGAEGELVLTHLAREAQPVVRYRTRDVVDIVTEEPCRCGRTGFRFRVTGRSDDMMHVRGINVFPSGVAEVLSALVPAVTGEFQILLSHPGPYDRLDIAVEHGAHVGQEELDELRRRVEHSIRESLTFGSQVNLVPPGSIPRSEVEKAIRVVRKY